MFVTPMISGYLNGSDISRNSVTVQLLDLDVGGRIGLSLFQDQSYRLSRSSVLFGLPITFYVLLRSPS